MVEQPSNRESTAPPRSGRLLRRVAERWRWYHFYFLLAMFDVMVIGASLFLYHQTLESYQVALRDLGVVEEHQRWMTRLRRTVIELNAPGNDIFESRDVDHEQGRFEKMQLRLKLNLKDGERFGIDPGGFNRRVDLSDFRRHIDDMIHLEQGILDMFARTSAGELAEDERREAMDAATVSMASMDRAQADALATLAGVEQIFQARGADLLAEYGAFLERSARFEKYFLATVVLILLGVFWYGRKLQRTYDQMTLDRQRAMEERHARLATVGEVCSSVAHGIRNPLAAIVISAQLALEFGTHDEDTGLRLRDVLAEGRRLDHRVTRLLDFARVPERAFEHFDLGEVVRQAVAEVVPQLDTKGIKVATSIDEAPMTIYGHSDQIAQSVIETLSNSMEHAPSNSRITVTCRRCRQSAASAVVSICDEGPGIDPKLVARVCELFCTTKADGNGIGLAFVKRAVELHNGSATIRSANPRGCCVELTLPLAR